MYANWSWEEQEIDCTETNLWCLRLPPWTLVRALIGFHSFTGWYTVRRFSSKGKITCWKSLKRVTRPLFRDSLILDRQTYHLKWQSQYVGTLYLSIVFTWDKQRRSQWCQVVAVQEKSSRVWKAPPPPPKLKLLYTSTYFVPITRPEYGIWLTLLIQYLPHGWTNEEGCLCSVRTLLKQAPDAVIELKKLQMSEI